MFKLLFFMGLAALSSVELLRRRAERGQQATAETVAFWGIVTGLPLLGLWALGASAGSAPANRPDEQRVVLVTGSTSGLGREVALRLGEMGAHVIVHGRDAERGREVVEQIESEGVGSAAFYAADLSSLSEVRRLAEEILRDYDRLDVLINNAGIGSASADGRELSEDGYELRFAVNYLSGFLLTQLLLPRLKESAPSRIINVASAGQAPLDFDNIMLEEGYSGGRAYSQSKLAQILLTFDLAAELEGTGVTVNALHPATFMDTPMVRAAGREPMTTVDEGADAVMNLVVPPDVGTGEYYNGLRPARANDQAYDADARARLKALSLELISGHE